MVLAESVARLLDGLYLNVPNHIAAAKALLVSLT